MKSTVNGLNLIDRCSLRTSDWVRVRGCVSGRWGAWAATAAQSVRAI